MTITILDGGMGQELVARLSDQPTPLWATQFMIDHPDTVRAIHADYFNAGATVATANTYAIQHDRLNKQGRDDEFADLHALALNLASEARDIHGMGQVAASLGPLGWSYLPDAPEPAVAAALFAEIVDLHAPHADLFLAETVSSLIAARGVFQGMAGATIPRWIAFSVDDTDGTKLRSGEPVAEVRPLIEQFAPDAVLINCARPEAVSQALPSVLPIGLPTGAYANGFTYITTGFAKPGQTVAQLEARTDLTPDRYADFAEDWAEAGVTIIGGCCEISPAHIAAVHRRLV
ncbi:MAG: homocysteine S-methyltransferase family protein [Pseudomonadota bacterium]